MLSSFTRNGRYGLESPFAALHDTLTRAGCVLPEEGRQVQAQAQPQQAQGQTAVYPVDIREDQTSFYVDAELPGFSRDEIQVTLDKGVLEIVATRTTPAAQNVNPNPAQNAAQTDPQPQASESAQQQAQAPQPARQETHLKERRYTRIARAFKLPQTIDESKVQARLDNGVLYLTIHKREETKPRQIPIN